MKKVIFTALTSTILLGACDKAQEGTDRLIEKLSWVYSESEDKLNNIKIQKVKKEFKNPEGTIQADLEFQCSAGKELTLQISTYQTKLDKGTMPGSALILKSPSSLLKGVALVKTRNGENKLAFPVVSENTYSNIAKISMKGVGFTPAQLSSIKKFVNVELSISDPGFAIAVDGNEIPGLFKSNEWVIEIPTEFGLVTPSIDMSNKNILKVFESCNWAPGFMNNDLNKINAPSKQVAENKNPSNVSHCKPDEVIQFTAEMGKLSSGKFASNDKILSLCSDQNLSSYIEYRYGKLGSPEMMISVPSDGQVVYETTANDPKSANTELTFTKGSYKYTVSTCSGMTCEENVSSLTVFNGDKQLTHLIASNDGLVTKLFDNSFDVKNPNNKLFKKK